MQCASAQLPQLSEPPWLGYFGVYSSKRYDFKITSQGKITLIPTNSKGEPAAHTLEVPVDIVVEETMPDGKITTKQIKKETLASTQAATDKLEKSVITGKVTGDAAFEATIEQSHGIISIGGRITDKGTLVKNPIRFAVRVKIPNAYPKADIEVKKEGTDKEATKEERRAERKAKREAEKEAEKKNTGKKTGSTKDDTKEKIADDRIDMKWTDGTRKKQAMDTEVDASSKDINGPGIAGMEIEISAYQGKKFLFIATPGSAMNLSNDKPGGLFQGFTVNWSPDAEKDKDGKARFNLEVK